MKNEKQFAFTQEQLDRLEMIASETPAERRRRIVAERPSESKYPGKDHIERAHNEWKDEEARALTYLGTPEKEAEFKRQWDDEYWGDL